MLSAHVLAMVMFSLAECRVPLDQVERLAAEIVVVEAEFALPNGLLAAVILAESGGKNFTVRGVGRGRRGCDSGPAQIHVPGCKRSKLKKIRGLAANIREGGRILAQSYRDCSRHPRWQGCRPSKWGRYNPASSTWWANVEPIYRKIRRQLLGGRRPVNPPTLKYTLDARPRPVVGSRALATSEPKAGRQSCYPVFFI